MKPPWNWPSVNSSAVVSDGVILGVAVRTAVVSLVMGMGTYTVNKNSAVPSSG
ncbi:unnamed protein product [Natator depressus]